MQAIKHKPQQPIEGKIGLKIAFVYKPPKNKKTGDLSFYPSYDMATSMKTSVVLSGRPKVPDLDNLVKFVKDALNGVFWLDDRQVCYLESSKIYGAEDVTVVEILSLE